MNKLLLHATHCLLLLGPMLSTIMVVGRKSHYKTIASVAIAAKDRHTVQI
jgi:hypothetical protein